MHVCHPVFSIINPMSLMLVSVTNNDLTVLMVVMALSVGFGEACKCHWYTVAGQAHTSDV